ncbi:MAG: SGNH/GDSL hydrolase family protein [bacterium]|nr:SGNH/GDSL hydrolase family protein [bacterium]
MDASRTQFASLALAFAITLAAAAPCAAHQEKTDIGLKTAADAWQFYREQASDPGTPRVLLIGDSIVNGYRGTVVNELNGKAAIDTWLTPLNMKNGNLLPDLKIVLSQGPYAVVHFNLGLHGWKPGTYAEGEHEALLREFVAAIKKDAPDAKLIWGSITPITVRDNPTELDPEHNPTIIDRNKTAARVMKDMKVTVDDLYTLMADKLDLAAGDKYHWKGEGRKIQGKQAAKYVRKALGIAEPESKEGS